MKILFCEDNSDDSALIEAVLRQEDCTLCFAKTFRECLEKIESFFPDLIVIDLNLSDSQPIQTIANIAQLSVDHAVVVLSGDSNSKTILEAKNAGAIDYISKSIINNGPELFSKLTKAWFISKGQPDIARSPITEAAIKRADIPQSELMLMLQWQNKEQDKWKTIVYQEFGEIKKSISAINTLSESRHIENLGNFKKVTDRQDAANGSVTTLKAKVQILEDQNKVETDDKIKKAIENQAVKEYKENTFSIRKFKLTPNQWVIALGILTILGYPTIVAWLTGVFHLIHNIFQFIAQSFAS